MHLKLLRLLVMSGLLVSFKVFAQGYSDPVPHLEKLANFCVQLEDEDESVRCLHGGSAGNWISSSVLSICSEQTWDKDKTTCALEFVNQWVEDSAVAVCASKTFPKQQWTCLSGAKTPTNVRTFFKARKGTGKMEVASICQDFFFDKDKDQCVMILNQADFFSPTAVATCQGFFTDKDKLLCLQSIANKWYFDFEAQKCGSLFTEKKQLQCFAGFQRKYRLLPARPN